MSIKPSIGRKVWFFDGPVGCAGCYSLDQPFDATVIYVWNPELVNLLVTEHNGRQRIETSVPLLEPAEGDRHGALRNGRESFATWMPFQMGQAKAISDAAKFAASDAHAVTMERQGDSLRPAAV